MAEPGGHGVAHRLVQLNRAVTTGVVDQPADSPQRIARQLLAATICDDDRDRAGHLAALWLGAAQRAADDPDSRGSAPLRLLASVTGVPADFYLSDPRATGTILAECAYGAHVGVVAARPCRTVVSPPGEWLWSVRRWLVTELTRRPPRDVTN